MKEKVQKVIDTIRPALQNDGGDIVLVDVVGDEVHVKLTGACVGCPMSSFTLTRVVEERIKEQVPEVKKVVAV